MKVLSISNPTCYKPVRGYNFAGTAARSDNVNNNQPVEDNSRRKKKILAAIIAGAAVVVAAGLLIKYVKNRKSPYRTYANRVNPPANPGADAPVPDVPGSANPASAAPLSVATIPVVTAPATAAAIDTSPVEAPPVVPPPVEAPPVVPPSVEALPVVPPPVEAPPVVPPSVEASPVVPSPVGTASVEVAQEEESTKPAFLYHITTLENYNSMLVDGKVKKSRFGNGIFFSNIDDLKNKYDKKVLEGMLNWYGGKRTSEGGPASDGTIVVLKLHVTPEKEAVLSWRRIRFAGESPNIIDNMWIPFLKFDSNIFDRLHKYPLEYLYGEELPVNELQKVAEVNIRALSAANPVQDFWTKTQL